MPMARAQARSTAGAGCPPLGPPMPALQPLGDRGPPPGVMPSGSPLGAEPPQDMTIVLATELAGLKLDPP